MCIGIYSHVANPIQTLAAILNEPLHNVFVGFVSIKHPVVDMKMQPHLAAARNVRLGQCYVVLFSDGSKW